MSEGFGELLAVLRCGHLGTAPSHAVRFACSGASAVVRAFDTVVGPIVDGAISCRVARRQARNALLFASVKTSLLISSYARMIGARFPIDLSVLAASFARVYDDLIDDIGGVRLEERIGNLLHGRRFSARTEFEQLLERLYHAIDERLDRSRDDPIYEAAQALHEYQALSRWQADPEISHDSLNKITAGKGGLANLVLFALVRPRMSVYERELVMRLGEVLQLMDDCVDVAVDRHSGITTVFTRRDVTLVDVSRRLRELSESLLGFYGRARGRQFVTVLYILLVSTYVKRNRRTALRAPAGAWATKSPLWILLCAGDGVRPRLGVEDS